MSTTTNPKKRDAAIKVMLTPAMREKLDQVAEMLGQTPATAASFAIGQWVAQQHRSMAAVEGAVEGLIGQVAPELVEQIKTLSGGKS